MQVGDYLEKYRGHVDETLEAVDEDQDGKLNMVELVRLLKLCGCDAEVIPCPLDFVLTGGDSDGREACKQVSSRRQRACVL